MNLLSVKDLSIKIGSKEIVDGINLDINSEEFIAIIGPSGCGKTTFLKTIAGFLVPDRGKIILNGNPVREPNKNMIMMFQEKNLMPWKTVYENIAFGPMVRNEDHDEDVKELASKVKLTHFLKNYPSELSAGMQQRVALAKTFISKAEIFLMDEPFNSLDVIIKRSMHCLLLDIWDKYKSSVLFVTHDISEAIFLADKIIVMTKLPMKIKKVIKINFDRPRKDNIIFSDEFKRLEKEITDLLKEEFDEE